MKKKTLCILFFILTSVASNYLSANPVLYRYYNKDLADFSEKHSKYAEKLIIKADTNTDDWINSIESYYLLDIKDTYHLFTDGDTGVKTSDFMIFYIKYVDVITKQGFVTPDIMNNIEAYLKYSGMTDHEIKKSKMEFSAYSKHISGCEDHQISVYSKQNFADFSKENIKYANKVISKADTDSDGWITPEESNNLRDIKDTYDLFADENAVVNTSDFIRFYIKYVDVITKQDLVTPDILDNIEGYLKFSNSGMTNLELIIYVRKYLGIPNYISEVDEDLFPVEEFDELDENLDLDEPVKKAVSKTLWKISERNNSSYRCRLKAIYRVMNKDNPGETIGYVVQGAGGDLYYDYGDSFIWIITPSGKEIFFELTSW